MARKRPKSSASIATTSSAATGFTIHHIRPDGTPKQLQFVKELIPGDEVVISTVVREKYAIVVREGIRTPGLIGVSPYSDWIQLQEGPNRIRVSTQDVSRPYTIEYTEKYGGL